MFYVCPNLDLKLSSQSLFLLVASSVTASCHTYSHVPSFVSVLLSHVLCFVSASLTPFLLSLMCLSCLVTVLALSCALLCLNITPLLRCLRVSRYSCSLMCLALSGSASRCSLKCFASAPRRSCALPCLSMTSHCSSVLCLFQATQSIAPHCYKVVQ